MATHSLDLTKHFEDFIEAGIAAGRFRDSGHAIREGLKLLEERELDYQVRLDRLKALAKEGFDDIERGDYVTLHNREEISAFFRQLSEEPDQEFEDEQRRSA